MELRNEAGQNWIIRSIVICTLHHILLDQIKEDEMVRIYSTYHKDKKYIKSIGQKNLKERRLERPSINRKVILQ